MKKAVALHERSVGFRGQRDYVRAKRFAREALTILQESQGRHDPDLANVLNHLAGIEEECGRYAEAQGFYQRSVSIMRKVRGTDPDIARVRIHGLTGLARVHCVLGDYPRSEPLYRRALKHAD